MEKARSFAQKGQAVSTQEALIKRDFKRAIAQERTFYNGVARTCFARADRGLGCPVRRPSQDTAGLVS
eukprot:8399534-Pyramimonas_sp.AAC.1